MVLSFEWDKLNVITFVDFEELAAFLSEGQDIEVFFPIAVLDCSISVLGGMADEILIYEDQVEAVLFLHVLWSLG